VQICSPKTIKEKTREELMAELVSLSNPLCPYAEMLRKGIWEKCKESVNNKQGGIYDV
jgi:hypothetical protein